MIAAPVYDRTASDYPMGQAVNLMFGHALSRISLSGVKVEAPGHSIKVKSVRFDGIYSAGTADLGASVPTWDVDETSAASYLLSVEDGELADVPLLSTSTKLTTEAGYMFLMPQSLARGAGQEVKMVVTLDMNGVEETQTTTVFHPAEWLAGRSYSYELVVEGNSVELVLVATEELALTDWDVRVMIQAVPLGSDDVIDANRLVSAIDGFGYLNNDNQVPSPDACKHFAIYLMNDILHDITIDMARFEGMFTAGENVIFDGKKIVNSWTPGSIFSVTFDDAKWRLAPSRQNVDDPLDASSGATITNPSSSITTYGTVMLTKLTDD